MSKLVKLAPGLSFPAEQLACEVTAAIGNRGGGKSNGCAVAVEQLLDAGVQVVVIDYVGIWFSLRLQPDGKTPSSYDIPVLGGRHGDVDLSPAAGAVVAEALAERRSSAILDVSLFSKSDRARFATDFAEAFFRAKKQHRSPCLVVLEEAQRYVPQRVIKGQERMLGAWEEIAEVGRNFGLGLFLISQRPQKINKDVLNLADNLLAFRTIGKHERVALEEWVQEKGAVGQRDIGDVLPGLPTGTCYAWSPTRDIFGKYRIVLKGTYDAGATPLGSVASVATRRLDLAELVQAMGKAVEAVQVGTPSARAAECERLSREVSRLERELASRPRQEEPVMDLAGLVQAVGKARAILKTIFDVGVRELISNLENLHDHIVDCDQIVADLVSSKLSRGRRSDNPRETTATKVGRDACKIELPRELKLIVPTGGRSLPTGERRVLVAVAQHAVQGGVTREQLTVLCGYRRSSRDTFIQRLRTAGHLQIAGDRLLPTDSGMRSLGTDYEELPTGRELLEYWRQNLPEGERRVLDCAVSSYPSGVSREEIDDATGYRRSSRDTFIQRLRARQLVTTESGVRASDLLFDVPTFAS